MVQILVLSRKYLELEQRMFHKDTSGDIYSQISLNNYLLRFCYK
jgi:hypothetical protein